MDRIPFTLVCGHKVNVAEPSVTDAWCSECKKLFPVKIAPPRKHKSSKVYQIAKDVCVNPMLDDAKDLGTEMQSKIMQLIKEKHSEKGDRTSSIGARGDSAKGTQGRTSGGVKRRIQVRSKDSAKDDGSLQEGGGFGRKARIVGDIKLQGTRKTMKAVGLGRRTK